MTPTPGDPVLLNHFTVAVYPFVHDLTAANRAARLAALDRRWAPWWARLGDRDAAEAFDGAAFFLPYIRGLLYPETASLDGEPPGEQFARWVGLIRGWSADGLRSWRNRTPADAVLRLTCRSAVHAPLSSFTLSARRGAPGKSSLHTEIPARLDWIDAVLFPSGLGFLAFKVRLDEEPPRLSRVIALNAGSAPGASAVAGLVAADAALRRRRGSADVRPDELPHGGPDRAVARPGGAGPAGPAQPRRNRLHRFGSRPGLRRAAAIALLCLRGPGRP